MNDGEPLRPDDPRARRRREQNRLFGVVIAFLVVVGGLTIWLVYGRGAAVLGGMCLLSGASVLFLLWGILWGIERLVQR